MIPRMPRLLEGTSSVINSWKSLESWSYDKVAARASLDIKLPW